MKILSLRAIIKESVNRVLSEVDTLVGKKYNTEKHKYEDSFREVINSLTQSLSQRVENGLKRLVSDDVIFYVYVQEDDEGYNNLCATLNVEWMDRKTFFRALNVAFNIVSNCEFVRDAKFNGYGTDYFSIEFYLNNENIMKNRNLGRGDVRFKVDDRDESYAYDWRTDDEDDYEDYEDDYDGLV